MLSLRPVQEKAADFLYECDRALVLAPVGSGKTAITLTALRPLLLGGIARRALVLAPLRVASHVWPAEAQKWTPDLRLAVAVGTPTQRADALASDAHVVVTNYDNIQWLVNRPCDFDVVIFDELTRLKDPSGKRFKALEKWIKDVPIRWGLTGSFTSNGLEDVFGQCKIVDQALLGRSKGAFLQQHFYCMNRDFNDWEPRPGALEAIMQRIRPATFLLEGASTDRALHVVPMPCQMDMTDYEKMKKDFIVQFPDATAVAESAGVVTQKLQQMASGFIYTPEPRWLSPHKFEMLDEILSENQGANTIVFYNYIEEREELARRYPHVRGPEALDDWNAGRVRLMALHPKSAGHGLNLQAGGHHIVFLSLPWSLELYEQAIGRLHRSGQQHDVWVYVLQTKGTIDERILTALKEKRSLSEIAVEALK